MDKPFFPPFGIGDVVVFARYEPEDFDPEVDIEPSRFWTIGQQHIIVEGNIQGVNDYEYATHIGAWIPHGCFDLVRKADEASIRQFLAEREECMETDEELDNREQDDNEQDD